MSRQRPCPNCQQVFEWIDGYPDLYGVRLCSVSCLEAWLQKYCYKSTQPDTHPGQVVEQSQAHQMGDIGEPPTRQASDFGPRPDPWKQMG
jgi:hypothetical protein